MLASTAGFGFIASGVAAVHCRCAHSLNLVRTGSIRTTPRSLGRGAVGRWAGISGSQPGPWATRTQQWRAVAPKGQGGSLVKSP